MLFCSCSVAKVPLIMVATRRSPWLKHVGAGESRDFWLFCSGFPGCSVAMGRMPQNQRDFGAETDGSNSKNPGKIGKDRDIYTYFIHIYWSEDDCRAICIGFMMTYDRHGPPIHMSTIFSSSATSRTRPNGQAPIYLDYNGCSAAKKLGHKPMKSAFCW